MIANETTLHKRSNDTEIYNYRSPYSLNNEQSLYRIVSYKKPWNDKCNTTNDNMWLNQNLFIHSFMLLIYYFRHYWKSPSEIFDTIKVDSYPTTRVPLKCLTQNHIIIIMVEWCSADQFVFTTWHFMERLWRDAYTKYMDWLVRT